jgi:FAD/FMN-containing dehydrogenase
VEHFGPDVWQTFAKAKKKYDPNGVLTPGTQMFG